MSDVGKDLFSNLMRRPWVSPGPTIDGLIASMLAPRETPTSRDVRVVTGPLGGGKSTGAMGATFVNAAMQPRWPDGIRRYRLLVLRDTYLNAWSQFVPFFEDWWPKTTNNMPTPGVTYEGAKGSALDIKLQLKWPDPIGDVDYMVQLRALGDHRTDTAIEDFFRGLPTTDIWLEEGDTLPEAVYNKSVTRLGRYPARGIDGVGARNPTLFLVSNQFLIGSWPYNLKMANRWKPGLQLFEQPSGLSPNAENLHNLSAGYYDAIIKESDERTVKRQVENEHVLPNAGTPVYRKFRDLVHSKPVTLDRNLPLRIGFDGGNQTLNPAAAIGQRGMARQLRFKSEITVEHGCGVERFAEMVNAELGKEQYAPWLRDKKRIICTVDPSAQYGADKKAGQANWIVAMERRTGLRIRTARSNDVAPRRLALREPMERMVDGHPGLVVDPEGCPVLRMGLGGLFHFPKIRAGMASRDADTPAKNHYSHVCEAAEYMAMDDEAYGQYEARQQAGKRRDHRNGKQEFAETD